MPAPSIDEIELADQPAGWSRLGFALSGDTCQIGSVRVRLAGAAAASAEAGIVGWSLRHLLSAELDGLPTTRSESPPRAPAPVHPNGVLAIDHVVAFSPDLDRTVAAVQAAGLDLRRIREQPTPAGAPRQAFFRLGREILEVVQAPEGVVASPSRDDASPEGERGGGPDRPARFWGLALLVEDLDLAAESFAPHLGEIRPAVQPGRRIATVRRSAGLAVPLALMSPDERPRQPADARATEPAGTRP
jgi:hypothetical protein